MDGVGRPCGRAPSGARLLKDIVCALVSPSRCVSPSRDTWLLADLLHPLSRGARVLDEAPAVLAPGGPLLVVQSELCGVEASLDRLRSAGLTAHVAGRCRHPFGPVLTRRAALLQTRGLIAPGQRHENLVVLSASPARGAAA